MASTHKHLRSSTANKRPTTSIADGQIALNTNTTSPGLFFKDSTGATIIKIGPVHVGTTAPNASPAAGGSTGNSTGEVWLDTSLTPNGVKIWNGSAWVNATPVGSTTVQGLLELATDAETQAGSDTARAVTPASLQSKMSDSATTTSATTIASSTAVKTAYDLANAALPKSGGTITGNLEIGTTGSLSFEGSTADAFETIIAVTDPTADRTITLPDTTGTVVTTGDTGTVTSTMIANGTIIDADINASAAIAHSKFANITAGQVLLGNASNVPTATALSGDVTINSSGVTAISNGVIVNADVNASAAIAGTKIAPDFGAQNITTTGTSTAASYNPTGSTVPTNGVYLPAANTIGVATNSTGRLFVDSSGRVGIGTSAPAALMHLRSDGNSAVTHLFLHNRNAGASAESRIAFVNAANDFSDNRYSYVSAITSGAGENGNSIVIATNPNGSSSQERLRVTSAGLVGIGASDPTEILDVRRANGAGNVGIRLVHVGQVEYKIGINDSDDKLYITNNNGDAAIGANTKGIVVLPTGLVGIGTSAPSALLHTNQASGFNIFQQDSGSVGNYLYADSTGQGWVGTRTNHPFVFGTNNSERARLDTSGRLLLGTSASITAVTFPALIQSNAFYSYSSSLFSADAVGSNFFFLKSRNATTGNHTVVQANDVLGQIQFAGSDGSAFVGGATISAVVDGTPGTNSMPGRIVLSTTAGGASSPTERLRITSAGNVGIGTSAPSVLLHSVVSSAGVAYRGGHNNTGFDVYVDDSTGEARLVAKRTGGSGGKFMSFYTDTGSGEFERARIDSSGRLLVGTSSQSGGALLQVNGDRVRIATAKTPASATDTGTTGEVCWDANYVYVCTATNTWKRAALSTW